MSTQETKILVLELYYKGKLLDRALENRDFTKRHIIGSDKFLPWQILSDSFPAKFTLVTKHGAGWKLHLHPSMKSDSSKKSEIDIKVDDTGSVTLLNDWEIKYFFQIPYHKTIPAYIKQMAKKFSRFPEKTTLQKQTSIMVFAAILITIGLATFFELTYEPPVQATFAEQFEKVDMATLVQVEVPTVEETPEEPVYDVTTQKAESAEQAEEVVQQAQQTSAEQFASEFGMDLDVSASGGGDGGDMSAELLEVTQVEQIAVATGGAGSGSSDARKGSSGIAALEVEGAGDFDLSSSSAGLADLGDLGGLDVGTGSGLEEVDLASLGSGVGDFKVTKIESKAQFEKVKRRFAGIKKVKEQSIDFAKSSPEDLSEVASINNVVNTYKPQIEKLYRVESMMIEMYGTVDFTLIINSSGTVEAVTAEVTKNSSFTDSFLEKARQIILKWKIPLKEPVEYSFRIKFLKQ